MVGDVCRKLWWREYSGEFAYRLHGSLMTYCPGTVFCLSFSGSSSGGVEMSILLPCSVFVMFCFVFVFAIYFAIRKMAPALFV